MKSYFDSFGDKTCCFEDLKPYLDLTADDLLTWRSFLENVPISYVSSIHERRLSSVLTTQRTP